MKKILFFITLFTFTLFFQQEKISAQDIHIRSVGEEHTFHELPIFHSNSTITPLRIYKNSVIQCDHLLVNAFTHTPTNLLSIRFSVELSDSIQYPGQANSSQMYLNCDVNPPHFTYTFLHELGHIHYFDIEKKGLQNPFSEQLPVYSDGIPNYLTEYATTNSHEDFAESFAMYLSNPELFEEKAQKSPVLEAKYEFIKDYIENYTQPSSTSISAASSSV